MKNSTYLERSPEATIVIESFPHVVTKKADGFMATIVWMMILASGLLFAFIMYQVYLNNVVLSQ